MLLVAFAIKCAMFKICLLSLWRQLTVNALLMTSHNATDTTFIDHKSLVIFYDKQEHRFVLCNSKVPQINALTPTNRLNRGRGHTN